MDVCQFTQLWLTLLFLSSLHTGIYCRKSGAPPKFQSYFPNFIAQAGATVTISCPVEKPEPDFYYWEKDGTEIELLSLDNVHSTEKSLTITNITSDNNGTYSCVVTNGNGQNQATFHISVTEQLWSSGGEDGLEHLNKVAIGASSNEKKVINGNAPVFSKFNPEEKQVFRKEIGSPLRMDCRGKGKPKPEVTWIKNGQILNDLSRTQTLHIRTLSRREAGSYTCILSNIFGNVNRSFEVEVATPKNGILIGPQYDGCQPQKPIIENVSQDSVVPLGMDMTLYCVVKHCREPIVAWFKAPKNFSDNGERFSADMTVFPHPDSDHRIEKQALADGSFRLVLFISNFTESDAGTYGCAASDAITLKSEIKYATLHFGDESHRKSENIFTRFQAMIIVGGTVAAVLVLAFGVCIICSILKSKRQHRRDKYSSTRRSVPADYVIVHQDTSFLKSSSASPSYRSYYEKQHCPSTIYTPNSVLHTDSGPLPVHLFHDRMPALPADSATEYEDILDDMSSYDYFRHPPSMVSSYAYSAPVARS